MTESIVHVDGRKRVSLAKYVKPAQHYRVEVFEGGTIRLTPVTVYTRSELAEATSPEIAEAVFADATLAGKHLTARQHPERFTSADDLP